MAHITIEHAMQIAIGHQQAGRLTEAEAIYRQILTQVPNHADALHFLGVLVGQVGDTSQAVELIGRSIAIAPAVAEYHSNLGEFCCRAGRWEEAIVSCRRAVELKPEIAAAHVNLGTALKAEGRLDEAITAYRRALALRPADAEIQSNIGVALHATGRLDEAIAALARAIELAPDQGRIHGNLGNVLKDSGRLDEAIAAYHRATQLEPNDVMAYTSLGTALHESGRSDEAIAAYRRGLAINLDVRTHADLGITVYESGRLDEAIAVAECHNNLGCVFRDLGRLDDALACFRKAVAVQPGFARAASNVLLSLHSDPDHDAQALLAEHRRWAAHFAAPLASRIRPHTNDRMPDRRLRIGFVSPDFRDHPVGRLLQPLFTHHDRRHSEFIVYSDVRSRDAVSQELEAQAQNWQSIVGQSDAQVADRIRDDGIDILVDLALHTAHNRLLVFARKPSPVQVTMLGLPATTGLSTIDYRLTDPYLDPPGENDGDYTEQSIRLPHCFWCYQPAHESPPVSALPALRNGVVTFGYLNQLAKVTRPTLDLWVKILQILPGSRLVLQSPRGSHLDPIRALFEEGGIAAERLEFVIWAPRLDYLRRFQDLDLGLDPFPYNGHSSTLDALWMGVPVVTLAGRTAVGRGGVSILSKLGLTELITRTPEQYLAVAVALAADRPRLAALRAELRPRMQASRLLDGEQYAADVETAFRRMWQTWCGRAAALA